MRPRKDPGIRQEAFIKSATELFMQKGYDDVSIRDILDAVADKTASPSVFYYYFPSKDMLYKACVEAMAQTYLSVMEEGFRAEEKTAEEWMLALVSSMEKYLLSEQNLIMTGSSTANRLFILDMREKVTGRIAALWSENLIRSFGVPEEEAEQMALFLAGGIGGMLFSFLTCGGHGKEDVSEFAEKAVAYCMNTIGMPEDRKADMMRALRDAHDDRGSSKPRA